MDRQDRQDREKTEWLSVGLILYIMSIHLEMAGLLVSSESSTALQRSVAGFFILVGASIGATGSTGISPEYKIPPHFHRISLSLLRALRELERSGCENSLFAQYRRGRRLHQALRSCPWKDRMSVPILPLPLGERIEVRGYRTRSAPAQTFGLLFWLTTRRFPSGLPHPSPAPPSPQPSPLKGEGA